MHYQQRFRYMTAKQKAQAQAIEQTHSKHRRALIRLLYGLTQNWLVVVLIAPLAIVVWIPAARLVTLCLFIPFCILMSYMGFLDLVQGWSFHHMRGGRFFITGFWSKAGGVAFILFGIYLILLAVARLYQLLS